MKYILESLIDHAMRQKCSDIHLMNYEDNVLIQFRIHGKLIKYKLMAKEEGNSLMNYIKFLSGLDLDHLLSLKTGGFTFEIHQKNYRFRVSSIPTMNKDHLVIRLLDQFTFTSLEQLTKDLRMIKKLREIEDLEHGLILLSGPTGVGKSTTLHVLLKEIYQKYHSNIITIEDPIETIVPEFTQIQISKKIHYDDALKQILRHDPDIIMIGELRDQYSANLAIRCALTGCLVFTTIHSKNAKSTLKRLNNLEIDQVELNEVLSCILSQKLIYQDNQSGAIFEYYDPSIEEYSTFEESMKYYEED